MGGRVSEGLPATPGDIRAFDVRTGELRWSFHTIPHPGEPGYETWPREAWKYSGGANNWAGMALDEARGILYAPTGSAAADFYGANRAGDNLYANSLDRARRRHREADLALPGRAPRHLGPRFPLPAQSRHGDARRRTRRRGRPDQQTRVRLPVRPRDGRAALSDRRAQRSRPARWKARSRRERSRFRARPAPFARQRLTEDMLTSRTPEARQAALEAFRKLRSDGQFVPFAVGRDTIVFPGFDGGAEWGGSAFDPEARSSTSTRTRWRGRAGSPPA